MTAVPPRRVGVEINPHIIGGAEHFLRALFAHLDRSRFVPVALAAAPGRWQPFLGGVVETHVVPHLTPRGEPADTAGALRRLDLDLMQSSYFSPATAFAATQAGIPHVWRMGGHVDALERQWTQADKDRLLTIVKLVSRRVVCGSRYLRSQFGKVGADEIDVIYNGLDLATMPKSAAHGDGSQPSVAMVAHLVPQKRHEVFLRAAAAVATQLPHTRFSIFGGGYGTPESRAYEESLRSLTRDLDLAGAVELRELSGQRFEVIGRADIIVFPGVNEGASNAVIEAMALSKPVIAARSGGNAELVDDGITGVLVPPDNPQALAVALLDLLRNPERRAVMGQAGRARVEREFDIRGCARSYEDFYARALGCGA